MRHAYGPHRDQWAELLLPQGGDGPFPVAVLVHGGNWQAAYGAEQMAGLARDLEGRGWATWNLEFRRVGPTSGGGWPQTGEDVLAGLDHLSTLDEPLDLARVVIVGFSSGGQLALWAAGERRHPGVGVPVHAAVSLAGVAHLSRRGDPTVVAFMGAEYDEAPEIYAQASPASRLPLGLPALLVHGDGDLVVPVSMSGRYAEKALAAGDDVTLAVIDGGLHMNCVDPASAEWQAAATWLCERLAVA